MYGESARVKIGYDPGDIEMNWIFPRLSTALPRYCNKEADLAGGKVTHHSRLSYSC